MQRKVRASDSPRIFKEDHSLTGMAHIYTWNPPWSTFQHLSLPRKIEEFKQFVQLSQEHFLHRTPIMPNEACIIIAPDLIFSPVQDHAVHSLEEKIRLDEEMFALKASLSSRSFVIAGSIEFLMADSSLYAITSHVITADAVETYDKKEHVYSAPRTLTQPTNTTVTMYEGEKSGYFEFRNFTISLEICQDHEHERLKKELGRDRSVDVQILLTAGQSIHNEHVCTPLSSRGILVQCELKPNIIYDAGYRGRKELETAVYGIEKKVKKASFRVRYLQDLGKEYDIKLHRQAGEDVGFDITYTPVALQLQNQLRSDLIINVLHQLIEMPEWSGLTRKIKIPFFGGESNPLVPEGFNKLKFLCDAYYRGTLNQKELFKKVGEYATEKLSEWSFTRNPLTVKLYQLLGALHKHVSDSELAHFLTHLQRIQNELTSVSVPREVHSLRKRF